MFYTHKLHRVRYDPICCILHRKLCRSGQGLWLRRSQVQVSIYPIGNSVLSSQRPKNNNLIKIFVFENFSGSGWFSGRRQARLCWRPRPAWVNLILHAFSGYGRRFMFGRLWVGIPAPYTGWTFLLKKM